MSVSPVSPIALGQIGLAGKPAVGQLLPARLRRVERPESQLTNAAAVELLQGGRLMERDLAILETAWMFSVVTTGQIHRLLFADLQDRRMAHRRLQFLYHEYCLNRVFRGLNQELVYTLDVQGARLIQSKYHKQRRQEIKWTPQSQGEKLLLLDHYLDVTEFAVQLTEAVRAKKGEVSWLGETVLTLNLADNKYLEPDGAGKIVINDQSLSFFLEWDRGTESLKVLAEKGQKYLAFRRNEAEWRSNFSRFPVVLFATTTPNRVELLLKHFGELAAAKKLDDLVILLTTHQAITAQGLLAEIWFQAGLTTRQDFAWGKGGSLLSHLTAA